MVKSNQIWGCLFRNSNAILVISLLIAVIYFYNKQTTTTQHDEAVIVEPKLSGKSLEADVCKPAPRTAKAISGDSIHHATDKGTMTPVEFVDHMKRSKRHGIHKEFASISREHPSGSFSYSRNSKNMDKNRYNNVFCFDDTRVKLKATHQDDDASSDYIHANYVDGFMQKNTFIAAQGPLPNTVNDFWRLIWQENVFVIVMTTRIEERGFIKCTQYWPTSLSETFKFGHITVTNINVDKKKDYIVTTLLLKDTKVGWCRQVVHFHFIGWPDFGVPESATSLLQFHSEIRQYQKDAVALMGSNWTGPAGGPPILVHCSAGIGRTGTFCAIDITLARLQATKKLNIYDTVRKIRTQRALSVQTPEQYEFCYLAVLESLKQEGKQPMIDLSKYKM